MPKNLFNWTFRDVEKILKENSFTLNYTSASHYFYTSHYEGILRNVCVPYHGTRSIKPRTLKGIILQSGLPKEKWLKG